MSPASQGTSVHAREAGARDNRFSRLVVGLRKLERQGSEFGGIHVIPPWPWPWLWQTRTGRAIRRLDAVLEPTKQAVVGMKKNLDKAAHSLRGVAWQSAMHQAAGALPDPKFGL